MFGLLREEDAAGWQGSCDDPVPAPTPAAGV